MIVRCAGCGVAVSEWAAACPRCGHAVEASIAVTAFEEEPEETPGPKVVHGLVIGDAPPDPGSAMWSRAASARPVWERSGLADPAPTAPAVDPSPVEPPVEATAADAAHVDGTGDHERRGRRRWSRVGAGAVATLAVVGIGWGVVRPHGEGGGFSDPYALLPIDGAPEAQWTIDHPSESFGVARSGDRVYLLDPDAPRTSPADAGVTVGALDASTGAEVWSVELPADAMGYGFTATGSGLLTTGERGTLMLLDRDDGRVVWEADRSGYVVGIRVGRWALLGSSGDGDPALSRLDVETGELEPIDGVPVAGYAGGILVRQDDALVAYERDTGREAGRWLVGDRDAGTWTTIGDLAIVGSNGSLTALTREGSEVWSVDFDEADSAGQMLTLDDGRLLVSTYGQRTQTSLVDVADGGAVRWTLEATLIMMVDGASAVVERNGRLELVVIEADGLRNVTTLGSLEDGSIWGVMDGAVLVRDRTAFSAVRPDGTEQWSVEVAPSASVFPFDGGFVVQDAGRLTFYA